MGSVKGRRRRPGRSANRREVTFMARRLEMVFTNAAGRRSTISVDNAREDITQQEVQSAMETIVSRGIFTTSGGDITAIDSARIIATEITEIPVE
jgi:elongation factor P hydroxylase